MASELVRVSPMGSVTWHSAVTQAASVLTPWGAAATITTRIAACASEISKFKLEADRLARTHAVLSQALAYQQQVIVEKFEDQKRALQYVRVNQAALITGWHKAVDGASNLNAPREFRREMSEIVKLMAGVLAADSVARGEQVIRFIDKINLAGTERDIALWRRLPR